MKIYNIKNLFYRRIIISLLLPFTVAALLGLFVIDVIYMILLKTFYVITDESLESYICFNEKIQYVIKNAKEFWVGQDEEI